MVIQLSNPVEYTGEGVADRGSLDEKSVAYWGRIEARPTSATAIAKGKRKRTPVFYRQCDELWKL
jgi:hypothetical protein